MIYELTMSLPHHTSALITCDTNTALTLYISVVTVIKIGTETAVFSQYRIEAKPRFYVSLLTVLETEQL